MAEIECCDTVEVHEDLLKIVKETMPDEKELNDLADLFKIFGDYTRIRILFVLFEAEVCVCDLAQALDMTQSAISHQLKILKQSRLVKSRREGKSIFYSLADEHVETIIGKGREHIAEEFLSKEVIRSVIVQDQMVVIIKQNYSLTYILEYVCL